MDLIPDFDRNGPYIWAVYILLGVVLGSMALWTLLRARAARRALEDIEAMAADEDRT